MKKRKKTKAKQGNIRSKSAGELLKQGLKTPPYSHNLKRMANDNQRGATISVCMIVKNEEKLLPRCLKSIQNLADEIILVDTGSEDRTVEIAERFGCRIYNYPWRGDFSSARNESLKYAAKDWIFIVDADEELAAGEIDKIKYFVRQPNINIISMSVFNESLETGEVSSFLPSIRLFRRKLGFKYEGIVHNRLAILPGSAVARCNIRLNHYGYDLSRDELEKKLARSRALLEKQIGDNPDDIYANFNMAQLLRGTKEAHSPETNRLILEHAGRVVENPQSRSEKYFGQYIMAHHQIALAHFNLKEYNEAEKYCLKALELKPDYIDPMLTLGNTCCAMEKLDKAGEYYHKYLEHLQAYNPDDETHNIIMIYLESRHIAWYGLGIIAERESETDEAIQCFLEALKARDNYFDSYVRLGRLYLDKKEPAQAERMFGRRLECDNDSAEAHFGLGEALSMQGDETKALTHFNQAVELAPNNAHIRFRLGKTLVGVGKSRDGIGHLIRATEIAPGDLSILLEAAGILFDSDEASKAADIYLKALEIKPEHADALNNLGNCYFRSGDYEKAGSVYERIIERNPGYMLAYRNMGLAYARQNKRGKALTVLTKYAENMPADFEVFRVIGELFSTIGHFGDAIGCYERYLKNSPYDQACLLNLAEAYYHLGFADAAAVGYKQVLNIDPSSNLAKERLASLAPSEKVV